MKRRVSFGLVVMTALGSVMAQNRGTVALSALEQYALAAEAFAAEEYIGAVEHSRLALEANPRYVDPMRLLAESYFALGEYGEALTHVTAAIPYARSDSRLTTLRGRVLVALGRFDEARELFDAVLSAEPNNLDAWFGQAELELAFGRTTVAMGQYRRALAVSPGNRRALLSLVLVLDASGLVPEASILVGDALRYHPRDAQVRLIAAKHYAAAKEYEDAEFHARRALELAPGYRDAALLLASVLLGTGRFDEGALVLEALLAEDRAQPLVWYALGSAYRSLDRIDDALNAFAFSSRYRPDDEIARISLERLAIDELPLSDIRRSRAAAYHLDLGVEYQNRNYLDRALGAYRRALLIDPRSREARLRYAELYRIFGFPRKYLNELAVLVELGYDDIEILDRIEIQESLIDGGVGDDWRVNQYDLQRRFFSFDIHVREADLLHVDAGRDIASFFRSVLLHRERIRVSDPVGIGSTFGTAFGRARNSGSDYFMLLDVEEQERFFSASVSIYHSATGSLLHSIRVLRTGNNRVVDTINLIAAELDTMLPVSGTIIDRRFDLTLVDVGRLEGVEVGDEFELLRPEALGLSSTGMGFNRDPSGILGTFTVARVDELVAEGTIRQNRFFDLVNVGDRIIEIDTTDQPSADPTQTTKTFDLPGALYREITRIR